MNTDKKENPYNNSLMLEELQNLIQSQIGSDVPVTVATASGNGITIIGKNNTDISALLEKNGSSIQKIIGEVLERNGHSYSSVSGAIKVKNPNNLQALENFFEKLDLGAEHFELEKNLFQYLDISQSHENLMKSIESMLSLNNDIKDLVEKLFTLPKFRKNVEKTAKQPLAEVYEPDLKKITTHNLMSEILAIGLDNPYESIRKIFNSRKKDVLKSFGGKVSIAQLVRSKQPTRKPRNKPKIRYTRKTPKTETVRKERTAEDILQEKKNSLNTLLESAEKSVINLDGSIKDLQGKIDSLKKDIAIILSDAKDNTGYMTERQKDIAPSIENKASLLESLERLNEHTDIQAISEEDLALFTTGKVLPALLEFDHSKFKVADETPQDLSKYAGVDDAIVEKIKALQDDYASKRKVQLALIEERAHLRRNFRTIDGYNKALISDIDQLEASDGKLQSEIVQLQYKLDNRKQSISVKPKFDGPSKYPLSLKKIEEWSTDNLISIELHENALNSIKASKYKNAAFVYALLESLDNTVTTHNIDCKHNKDLKNELNKVFAHVAEQLGLNYVATRTANKKKGRNYTVKQGNDTLRLGHSFTKESNPDQDGFSIHCTKAGDNPVLVGHFEDRSPNTQ